MDSLPNTDSEYRLRVYEVQGSNEHGVSLVEWYSWSLEDRTVKVTATLLPGIYATLDRSN